MRKKFFSKGRPEVDKKNSVRLQFLLILGIVLILIDLVGILPADLGIPVWLGGYLILTSGYFAMDPHRRIEERWQKVLAYACFPGAFVTLLVPFYAGLLFVAKSGAL
jgi:hypothetical protein